MSALYERRVLLAKRVELALLLDQHRFELARMGPQRFDTLFGAGDELGHASI
jgi:hypothetical protein